MVQIQRLNVSLSQGCRGQIKRNHTKPFPNAVRGEQIFTIDKSRIERFMGYASKAEMLRIDMALLVSLALNVLSENRSE